MRLEKRKGVIQGHSQWGAEPAMPRWEPENVVKPERDPVEVGWRDWGLEGVRGTPAPEGDSPT